MNDHADRFIVAIDRKLNSSVESSDKYIRIPFMHAVYYKLFGNRTELRQRDFKSEYFERGWDHSYQKREGIARTVISGSVVIFPIVTHLYRTNSRKGRFCKNESNGTYSKKPMIYNEMLRIFVNKQDCK